MNQCEIFHSPLFFHHQQNSTRYVTTFEAACRGEYQKTATELSQLKCRYETHNNPFLKIAPFKVEELNLVPPIVRFHEIISDNEIEYMKNQSIPKFIRAGVVDNDADTSASRIVSGLRICQHTWLDYRNYSVVATLHQRLADMTGLSMVPSEILQVANYGIGGHYAAHHDYFELDKQIDPVIGNRISTTIIYVSD